MLLILFLTVSRCSSGSLFVCILKRPTWSTLSISINGNGAFCSQWTTTSQPVSSASEGIFWYKWKFERTGLDLKPLYFTAFVRVVCKVVFSMFPQILNPKRQPYFACSWIFLRNFLGSGVNIRPKLHIILSNFLFVLIGCSASATPNYKFCLLTHSSKVNLLSNF